MKAMILAAGRGERMRPLTLTTPKPLLRVKNTTLIEHALNEVKKAGVIDVVINVHHLGDQIIQHCGDGSAYGLRIRYSIEEELLDTGGGIYRALPLLGDSPFLLLSADIWTDYPLKQLMQKSTTAAHLILVDNPDYHATGDFGLDENNIIRRHVSPQFTYANIGVLHPQLFKNLRQGMSEISDGKENGYFFKGSLDSGANARDCASPFVQHENLNIFPLRFVLFPAIEKGIVTGERYNGQWYNIGTPAELTCFTELAETRM